METMNWIEKIKETVHIAMGKKLSVEGTYDTYFERYTFEIGNNFSFHIYTSSKHLILYSPKGKLCIDYSINDREDLELRSLVLSIKEYQENTAISELEEFVSEKIEAITDINSLDDDE